MASNSDKSNSFSVTVVCMAHSFEWAFRDLPHFLHLYCVVP